MYHHHHHIAVVVISYLNWSHVTQLMHTASQHIKSTHSAALTVGNSNVYKQRWVDKHFTGVWAQSNVSKACKHILHLHTCGSFSFLLL